MKNSTCMVLLMVFSVLPGCVAHIGAPQSREEFVTKVKPGGFGRKSERMTINRPFNAVAADLRTFSDKCLNVRVTRSGSYQLKEVGGATTYHPKIVSGEKKVSLSLQEEYSSKHANSGAPPGGVFVMVTELRPLGDGKTQAGIYHLYKGEIVDPLKDWLAGEKRQCPSFD